ncbi:MAG TPA: CopG family transcriptional regulator [Kiritimatiellia bacterium]|nr:CopG family transcriptional regulator [Kiritimatiellia bacterium]
MTTLTIRIPDTLRKELKTLSRSENKAMSDIVRESIRRHVALQRFRSLRSRVLPFAEAQGILTDEDVFRALK